MSARLFSGRYLAIAIPVIILQLVVFKLLYPFASHFFTDPFSYLSGAVSNLDTGSRPVETLVVCWLANSLSAAALFTGLGLLWLTVLIGMLGGSPVYPVRQKMVAILLSLLPGGGLMRYTIPTAGWQLANNALYAYGNTYKTSIGRPPARYAVLDSLVWPNAIMYAMPPMEDAAEYKGGMDRILLPHQFLHMAVNLFFGVMVWLFVTTKGMARASPMFSKCLMLMAVCWLVHLVLGILTAPVVFRNEVVVMIGCPVFSLLSMERLLALEKNNPAGEIDHSNNSSHEEDKYDHRRLRILPDLSVRLRSDR